MRDELYDEAKEVILETGVASVSQIMRFMRLGYTRAARIMDELVDDGIVSLPESKTGKRTILKPLRNPGGAAC